MICPLQVGGVVLPLEELKYPGVSFTSEGKMECEIDRQMVQPLQLCGRCTGPLW